MYKQLICEHCGDPANKVRRVREHFFPFKTKTISAFCNDCFGELYKGRIPDVTGPQYRSKKGKGIKERKKHFD